MKLAIELNGKVCVLKDSINDFQPPKPLKRLEYKLARTYSERMVVAYLSLALAILMVIAIVLVFALDLAMKITMALDLAMAIILALGLVLFLSLERIRKTEVVE